MFAAALFKILQNPSVQLKNLPKPFPLQQRARLLATNAAGAKHDDRLLLERRGQPPSGAGKIAKMSDSDGQRVLERPKLALVVFPCVEQRSPPAFIEPLLQFARRQFGRWMTRRIDPLHAKSNNF